MIGGAGAKRRPGEPERRAIQSQKDKPGKPGESFTIYTQPPPEAVMNKLLGK